MIDMPAIKRITAVLCALFALTGVSPTSAAQAPRVVLAVDGIGEPRNLPVLLAERLGYFVDEGLIVTLDDSPASPTPAELLKDGRADGAVAYFHHTFSRRSTIISLRKPSPRWASRRASSCSSRRAYASRAYACRSQRPAHLHRWSELR